MSELEFLVITSLARGRQHGYGVLLDVRAISAERVRPQVATLYRQLDRLASEGLVADDGNEVVDGRFRRYYRLTDRGVAALADSVELRAATIRVARHRLRQRATISAAAVGSVS